MAKKDKNEVVETAQDNVIEKKIPTIADLDWTDYVLGLLSDDEKISHSRNFLFNNIILSSLNNLVLIFFSHCSPLW